MFKSIPKQGTTTHLVKFHDTYINILLYLRIIVSCNNFYLLQLISVKTISKASQNQTSLLAI